MAEEVALALRSGLLRVDPFLPWDLHDSFKSPEPQLHPLVVKNNNRHLTELLGE